MHKFLLLVLGVLLMTGCGRKEPPQVIVNADVPDIASIKESDAFPRTTLEIQLAGGAGGVGYQMDRAEMDPYCKCPSVWRRYYEEPPQERNHTRVLQKMLRLQVGGNDFAYRLRAIDAAGRLGTWQRLATEAK